MGFAVLAVALYLIFPDALVRMYLDPADPETPVTHVSAPSGKAASTPCRLFALAPVTVIALSWSIARR